MSLSHCINFATRKHEGQIYYGFTGTVFKDEPYICHCLRVMLRLSQKKDSYDLMQIGVMHDLLEDTDATLDEIRIETGVSDRVLQAIEEITKKPHEEYAQYIERLSSCSLPAQIVKIEDLFENLSRNPPESLAIRYRKAILKLSPALAEEMN